MSPDWRDKATFCNFSEELGELHIHDAYASFDLCISMHYCKV